SVVPGRRPRPATFPYTTLFRSNADLIGRGRRPGKHKPTTPEALGRDLMERDPEGGGRLGQFLGGGDGPSVFGVMSSSLNILQDRSEEHTSELQSRENLVCRLLL